MFGVEWRFDWSLGELNSGLGESFYWEGRSGSSELLKRDRNSCSWGAWPMGCSELGLTLESQSSSWRRPVLARSSETRFCPLAFSVHHYPCFTVVCAHSDPFMFEWEFWDLNMHSIIEIKEEIRRTFIIELPGKYHDFTEVRCALKGLKCWITSEAPNLFL